MVWVQFIVSSAIIVIAATRLAQYGDVIAVRTKLSGMFIGTLLMAGATSLPELLSAVNAIQQGTPNLAAGGMFGSSMFNMFALAVLDLMFQNARVLRIVAFNHAMTASLGNLMLGMAAFFILADFSGAIGWVGLDSLAIMIVYFGGIRLIQGNAPPPKDIIIDDTRVPSLRKAVLGFLGVGAVLFFVTPYMVESVVDIAIITGMSTGFVGALLLAVVTSFPELVTTYKAIQLRAFDLAVGNLFGSNIFNMFALGLTDFFYTEGRFLGAIDKDFALAGLLALLLTSLGLIGNLARVERKILFMEIDAMLIIIAYFAGMIFLFVRGIGV